MLSFSLSYDTRTPVLHVEHAAPPLLACADPPGVVMNREVGKVTDIGLKALYKAHGETQIEVSKALGKIGALDVVGGSSWSWLACPGAYGHAWTLSTLDANARVPVALCSSAGLPSQDVQGHPDALFSRAD